MNHKDLEVWKKSVDLVVNIYNKLENFPNGEKYGMISQIKRAAVSIPSNIAEGCARSSDKELLKFIDIACGSLAELETQIIIFERLSFIEENLFGKQIDKIGRMLSGLKKRLKEKENKETD